MIMLVRPRILAVAEFARIHTPRKCLNSGEFSYDGDCQELLPYPIMRRLGSSGSDELPGRTFSGDRQRPLNRASLPRFRANHSRPVSHCAPEKCL